MYFLNLKKLENELINNTISENEGFKYFFFLTIISMIPMYLESHKDIASRLIECIIQIVIAIIGIKKTFSINKSGDGKQYYIRYFSLSFVTMFRVLIFYMIILIFYHLLSTMLQSFFGNTYIPDLIFNFSSSLLIGALYYMLICKSFKKIAAQGKMNEQMNDII